MFRYSEIEDVDYIAEDHFIETFSQKVVPFAKAAKANGYQINFLVAGANTAEIRDFMNDISLEADVFTADDILLKTIIRSNPGIMIMNNGEIVDKFHISKLPLFDQIKK